MSSLTQVAYGNVDGAQRRICSFLCSPLGDNSRRPAVLLLRGTAGPMDGYIEIARRVSDWGYHALVHDWQVRGNNPSDADVLLDLAAAFDFIATHPNIDTARIAVVGFCRGGIYAFLAAEQSLPVSALVIFHGFCYRALDEKHAGQPYDIAARTSTPTLLLHGVDDKPSPIAAIRELKQRILTTGTSCELHEYSDTGHGFAVSTHPGYSPRAAAGAFLLARQFLVDAFATDTKPNTIDEIASGGNSSALNTHRPGPAVETGTTISVPLLEGIAASERLVRSRFPSVDVCCRIRRKGIVVELDETTLASLDCSTKAALCAEIARLWLRRANSASTRPVTLEPYRRGNALTRE